MQVERSRGGVMGAARDAVERITVDAVELGEEGRFFSSSPEGRISLVAGSLQVSHETKPETLKVKP